MEKVKARYEVNETFLAMCIVGRSGRSVFLFSFVQESSSDDDFDSKLSEELLGLCVHKYVIVNIAMFSVEYWRVILRVIF
jgi:hypothetical protein